MFPLYSGLMPDTSEGAFHRIDSQESLLEHTADIRVQSSLDLSYQFDRNNTLAALHRSKSEIKKKIK